MFLFLPLTLLLLPFCRQRHRKLFLAAVSVAWFVLACYGELFSMLQILLMVVVCAGLGAIPDPEGKHRTVLCAIGVALPLSLFVMARLLAEYGPADYHYPYGLTFVMLGAVSYAIDRYRGDAPDHENPLHIAGYMLFFPVVTMGPMLRYKQYLYATEHARASMPRFSLGVRMYMLGYIKRIAVSAVVMRALDDLLSYGPGMLPLASVAFALLLAYFLLYFFVSGCTDMARGLMAMYGLQPPRGQAGLLDATTPGRMLYGMLLSLDRFLEDYVVKPLTHRTAKGGSCGLGTKILARVLVCLLTVCFWRMRPEMLIFGLPVLIVSLLTVKWGRWERLPRKLWLRIPCTILSGLAVSLFALASIMEKPSDLFAILGGMWGKHSIYSLYHMYTALADAKYLAVIGLLLAVLLPLQHFWPRLRRHMPVWLAKTLHGLLTVLLFAGFVVTLIYVMPQFPYYSYAAYYKLYL